MPPPAPPSLSGAVVDFQTGEVVPSAAITAFECGDFVDEVGAAVGDGAGSYSLGASARVSRWHARVVADGQLETYHSNISVEPSGTQTLELETVSMLTANALPAFIGVTRTDGRGLVIGTITDCNGDRVANALATVSTQPGSIDHLADVETYYFSALSTSLPVRPGHKMCQTPMDSSWPSR